MDITELKEKWTGWEFDERTFQISGKELREYALACGETQPRYVDPEHPDFQAVPNYTARFHGRRQLPENFPVVQRNLFDGGKTVEPKGPIRPGDTITAKSHIHDLYEKTGRSGGMKFIVHRMHFFNEAGDEVAVVDWKMIEKLG